MPILGVPDALVPLDSRGAKVALHPGYVGLHFLCTFHLKHVLTCNVVHISILYIGELLH